MLHLVGNVDNHARRESNGRLAPLLIPAATRDTDEYLVCAMMDVPVVATIRFEGEKASLSSFTVTPPSNARRIAGSNADKTMRTILFQILGKKVCQLIPRNQILGLPFTCLFLIPAIVEVAMRGIGDDEQLLVLGVRVGIAYELVPLSLAIHHRVLGSLTKIARLGIGNLHHENGRAYFVDVIEEAAVSVCLCTDNAPAVVRVA